MQSRSWRGRASRQRPRQQRTNSLLGTAGRQRRWWRQPPGRRTPRRTQCTLRQLPPRSRTLGCTGRRRWQRWRPWRQRRAPRHRAYTRLPRAGRSTCQRRTGCKRQRRRQPQWSSTGQPHRACRMQRQGRSRSQQRTASSWGRWSQRGRRSQRFKRHRNWRCSRSHWRQSVRRGTRGSRWGRHCSSRCSRSPHCSTRKCPRCTTGRAGSSQCSWPGLGLRWRGALRQAAAGQGPFLWLSPRGSLQLRQRRRNYTGL